MKKIFSILLVLILAITVLTGCSAKSDDGGGATSVDDTSPSYDFVDNVAIEKPTEPTTVAPRLSDEYAILASGVEENGDEYELVGVQNEDENSGGVEIGVIKNNEWLVPISSKHPFINKNGYVYLNDESFELETWMNTNVSYYENERRLFFKYCGNGCFFNYIYEPNGEYEYTIGTAYNSESKKSFVINWQGASYNAGFIYITADVYVDDFEYRDYISYIKNGYVNLLNLSTMTVSAKIKATDSTIIGPYSNGLVFVGKLSSEYYDTCGFYNSSLSQVFDLDDYVIPSYSVPYYQGDAIELITYEGEKKYRLSLDENGNEISKNQTL